MGDNHERHHLYVIGTIGDHGSLTSPVKVGITSNWRSRLKAVQTGSARKVEYAFVFNLPNREIARAHEKCFHDVMRKHAMSGEWFDMKPFEAVHAVCLAIQALMATHLTDFTDEEKLQLSDMTRASEAMALLSMPTEFNRHRWDA